MSQDVTLLPLATIALLALTQAVMQRGLDIDEASVSNRLCEAQPCIVLRLSAPGYGEVLSAQRVVTILEVRSARMGPLELMKLHADQLCADLGAAVHLSFPKSRSSRPFHQES